MDKHFDVIFGRNSNSQGSSSNDGGKESFIPSKQFSGAKNGYIFQNGEKGTGYYLDNSRTNKYIQPEYEARKRKFDEENAVELEEKREAKILKSAMAPAKVVAEKTEIEEYIEEVEKTNTEALTQLDVASLKQLLLNFEKKINKNQKLRMKFADEPEKFMDSEIELHQEIQNLFIIAAYPELYPILFQTNALKSILEMINHENTDISLSTINLLQEMTDIEIFQKKTEEDEEEDDNDEEDNEVNSKLLSIAQTFVKQLQSLQGIELLIQNLSRLQDDKLDEDAQGVYHTMSIIENLVTINPSIATEIVEKTSILSYLFSHLMKKEKKLDMNKLYFAEILSILLQSNPSNQFYLITKLTSKDRNSIEGLELLLQTISNYRKLDIEVKEEEEFIENLFLCLQNCLSLSIGQEKFIFEYEGLELMNKIFYEQRYASICILKIIHAALLKNITGIIKFIDLSGLKILFSLLMKKGLKSSLMKKLIKRDEYCLSLLSNISMQFYIHSLFLQSSSSSSSSSSATTTGNMSKEKLNEYMSRFIVKFYENDYEKLIACFDLFIKSFNKYEKTLEKLENIEKNLILAKEKELLEEFHENLYFEKLNGGLYEVQQALMIFAFLSVMDKEKFYSFIVKKLEEIGFSMKTMIEMIRDMIIVLKEQSSSSSSSEEKEKKTAAVETLSENIDGTYLETLVQWSAILSQFQEA